MIIQFRLQQWDLNYLCVTIFFGLIINAISTSDIDTSHPVFAEPISNITVTAGRNVSLQCVVDNLQNYRVAWIHTKQTLLTLQNRVITRSSRFKVSNNSHRTWFLHIYNVQERDRGEYMCQINTIPMMSQVGYLNVNVPPYLDEKHTSSDTDVKEGSDVSLRCSAKGFPEPNNTWRREDGQEISLGKDKETSVKGNYLNITKVTRLHMGAYLCIFSNGVPPSLSKRIILGVTFTPMIWIPNQLVGAPVATNVLLQCNLESHPRSVTYWIKEGGIMVLSNSKFRIEVQPTVLYKFQLKLYIQNLQPEDYGSYTCVAKNSLGETQGTIRLYEIPPPSSIMIASGENIHLSKSEKLRNGQNTFKKQKDKNYSDQDSDDPHTKSHPREDFSHILEKEGAESISSKGIRMLSPILYSFVLCCHHIYKSYLS